MDATGTQLGDGYSRRRFLANTCALSTASLLCMPRTTAAEPALETTKIRLVHEPGICLAPQYLAEEFLRMEGFTEIEYVKDWTTYPAKAIDEHRADFTQNGAWAFLPSVESGGSTIALAGVHVGCYELFANHRIRGIRELEGATVAVPLLVSPDQMLLSSMLSYVGVDPSKDVKWIAGSEEVTAMTLYLEGKADAYMAFAPQGHELRAKKAGHVIVNTSVDRPWSQYFCCIVVGSRDYIATYPNATKRALRAFLKAGDMCAKDPQRSARMLVDRGFESRYEVALEVLKELPYNRWRESDPEDTLRFYALRLHELGIIKSTPKKIIAQGTNWRFLNELKKELRT